MTVTTQRSVGMPRATMAALMLAVFTVSVGYGVVLPLLPYLIERLQTRDISGSIRQDVLLLAGGEDHYVPMERWHHQIRTRKNARSITGRLFTRSEFGQNHCQVGNYGLALRTIVNWLDEMQLEGRGELWANGTPRPCQVTSSSRRSAGS